MRAPLLMEFANARLELTRLPELAPSQTLELPGAQAHLFGRPGWLVNYRELAYEGAEAALAALPELLNAYLADPAQGRHLLARLSGAFLLLIARGGRLEQVITSDELPNLVYWHWRQGQVVISDHWRDFALGRDLKDPAAYSLPNLRWFSARKTCIPGQTWLEGLYRLRPATIYRLEGDGLVEQAAVYPLPVPGQRLGNDELYAVVGRRLGPGPFSLCYSTGIDSHHLLSSLAPRVQDVCTIYYSAPFQDQERSREASAALVNCLAAGKPYTPVAVDLADPSQVPFTEHAVLTDPFAAHHSCSMYRLFAAAQSQQVVTGQNADTMQFFALTSRMGPKELLFKSPASRQSPAGRLYYRWSAARSFGRPPLQGMLARRMLLGLGDQMARLTGPHGYWPIFYFKRIHNMTTGNTALFKNAARYWGKQVFFPYTEPLVFYVAAYYRRPLRLLLNPKGPLKARYHYLRHSQIELPFGQGRPFRESPLFAQAAQGLERVQPQLKAFFETQVREPMALVVLYTFARLALEGR